MSNLLTVSNLNCTRRGKTILKNIGFSLRQGEYTAILGPNGAGKSTLLKCLVRLVPCDLPQGGTSCTIQWNGEDSGKITIRELAQKAAYVPQVQSPDFPFTVRQFVEAARYAHQSPWDVLTARDRELCENALFETGLEPLAYRKLETLSGGELQSVWLAGALAQNPDVFLLDESTSQMDYKRRMEIFGLLHRLNRNQGKTIVSVTHDVNEAAQNADRILALRSGELVFDGPTKDFMNESVLEAVFDTKFLLIPAPELKFPAVLPKGNVRE